MISDTVIDSKYINEITQYTTCMYQEKVFTYNDEHNFNPL